ncbi:MAG: diguanylate cyclase [Chloroflexi bacterium]|nr:diguanylate cyclase [Chloroflexota bacterium]
MIYNFLPVDLVFFGSAVLSLFIALVIILKHAEPGGTAFALVMISVSLWLVFRVFEGVAESISDKVFWAKFEYLGIATLPAFYFIFASQFSRKDRWITTKNLLLFSVIPLLTLVLVFTNDMHGLIWSNIRPSNTPGIDNLIYTHGVFFWIYWVYSYIFLAWGIYRLISTFLNFSKIYRVQIAIMVITTLIPWVGNLLYVLGKSPVRGMDLTPLGLALSGLILTISLYRGQIFEITPMTRNLIFDSMQEGILVVDLGGKISDANAAVQKILDVPVKDLLKKQFRSALERYPHLIENLDKNEQGKFEICLDEAQQKYVQVSCSMIVTNVNPSGSLIVFQDISKRKKLEIYEREQRSYADALASVAATLNSSLDLDVVLERMLEVLEDVVPHDAASVVLLDDEEQMHFVKLKGYDKFGAKEAVEGLHLSIDDIPDFRNMAADRTAVLVSDTKFHPAWVQNAYSQWIRSYIGSPIVVNGNVIGFINVDSSTPNQYTEEHAQRLKVFADAAAIAVQNARYVDELKHNNQDLSLLFEIGREMTQNFGTKEIIDGLVKKMAHFPGMDIFNIALIDPDSNKLNLNIYHPASQSTRSLLIPVRMEYGILREVIERKELSYHPDYSFDNIPQELQDILEIPVKELHSVLGIPLLRENQVIGLISVISRKVDAMSKQQIQLFETIASQVSVYLHNVFMYDRMKELAIIDELTGIYNRRFFYIAANKEITRSVRYKKDLSFILIDIDHYKEVNDHYGHLAGDKVLQRITQVIQKELRTSDVFARYGGEEFLILLSDTPGDAAFAVAERIRQKVAALRVHYDEEEISVTISLGVTSLTKSRNNLQEIMAVVDQALYSAKQKGRDRVDYIA